ncbi:MAG TPA: peptidase E [Solirubrobacterales bacterium]|nr:peptidase E [Solirubrobacterales bacterium]
MSVGAGEQDPTVIALPGRDRRQIVSFGGGGFSMEAGNPLLDEYVLRITGKERPRVCFLPTASGDADHYIVRFYRAFAANRCEPTHLSLFRREQGTGDIRELLLSQDLIYVGGGSVLSMLGAWRAHGLDLILRDCWQQGVVLCGLSAGSLCWFAEGVTSFHGAPRRYRGLGLLPFSNCVHYGDEVGRRESYHQLLRGGMCPGYAAADGAALHFAGRRLIAAVSSRPKAKAWCVGDAGTDVAETELPVRFLGEPEPNGESTPPLTAVA